MSNETKEFYALMDKGPWALAKEVLALRDREKVLVEALACFVEEMEISDDGQRRLDIAMDKARAALMTDADQIEEAKRRG